MPDIKELAGQLRDLEKQLAACTRCGMCQSVCPLFEQTGREADVARGKLALIDSLMNEIFDNPDGVHERLSRCLLCGSCAANCPSGVNVTGIFLKARIILTGYMELPFVKKVIFRSLLARPALFDRIIEWGSKLQRPFLSRKEPDALTSSVRFLSPLLNGRTVVPAADQPFQTAVRKILKKTDPDSPTIAFFTGCLIDKFFPDVGMATVKALQHHDYNVFIPRHQGCCGIPALAAGDSESFSALLRYNLDLFSSRKFDYLLTSCATCTSTIKKLWPSMSPDSDASFADKAAELSDKTMDISQFLCRIAGAAPEKTAPCDDEKIVTYHDPCHLAKSLNIRKEPRQLIQASPGCQLKEMQYSDRCCGMGGSFNLYHYDISSEIGGLKRKHIEETGCHTIATSCPACMLQISDMLSRSERRIKIKHPVELYAQNL